MRKLALVLSAFGFIAYSGIAHADDKAENTEKSDVSHTLTGKKKISKSKKSVSPDGTTTEMKSETTLPKSEEQGVRRDEQGVRRDDTTGSSEASEKVESKTTLGGKRQIKSTKEFKGADGRESESTRTTTSPENSRTAPDTNK